MLALGLRYSGCKTNPRWEAAGEGGAHNGGKDCHVEDAGECRAYESPDWKCGFGVKQREAHWV